MLPPDLPATLQWTLHSLAALALALLIGLYIQHHLAGASPAQRRTFAAAALLGAIAGLLITMAMADARITALSRQVEDLQRRPAACPSAAPRTTAPAQLIAEAHA